MEWIDVNERLPNEEESKSLIIVYCEYGRSVARYSLGYMNYDDDTPWMCYESGGREMLKKVSHWCSMPSIDGIT